MPFTLDQFLGVFRDYNAAVWPAQLALVGIALVIIVVARLAAPSTARVVVPCGLAALWAWTGAVYHLRFFAGVNPAARVFGVLFLVQAILWLLWTRNVGQSFWPRRSAQRWVGVVLLAYALVGYPLLNIALGHRYPAMPTFGAPCPTVIATFGLMSWASPSPRWWLWCVPVVWALLGISAAVNLGILEDFGLPIAAAASVIVQARAKRSGASA